MKSLFIVFEGIDGSGKTTLIQNLFDFYTKKNLKVEKFQEPTNYETGQKIRKFLKGEFFLSAKEQLELFIKDREHSVERNILPNLQKGNTVLLDRYFYSTCAYQGKNEQEAFDLYEQFKDQYPKPNFLFYLNIDPQEAIQRCKKRQNLETFETNQQLTKIQKNYQAILQKEDIILLDAQKSIKELLEDVILALEL